MARLDVKSPEDLLRLGFGLVPIAAGADKFSNLLTRWEQYLDPGIARALPMKPATFMKLVGVVEMGVGALVLTRFRKQAAYVASAWLAAITGNLLIQGRYLDIAARDALLSLCAYAFARLEEQPSARSERRLPVPRESRTLQQPGRAVSEPRAFSVEQTSATH